jgi:hypothetical protein
MMDPSTIKLPDSPGRPQAKKRSPLDHATGLILRVCQLAGSASFVDDARESLEVSAGTTRLTTQPGP